MTEEKQEMLKWAAKAISLDYTANEDGEFLARPHPWDEVCRVWNPLEDDTATRSLFDILSLKLEYPEYREGVVGTILAKSSCLKYVAEVPWQGVSYRDAIVQVAAEIGKNIPD